MLLNGRELLSQLDQIGAELGRAGNNINQLARHANVLSKQRELTPEVAANFNKLFDRYIGEQREIEKVLRHIIRFLRE
jgi:hypothetical protein